MAAANARVIAFGASAGLIFQVQKALKETVRATVEVEKALTDINIVLGAGSKELQDFGNRLFKVAAQTGQSFKTIAAGATELARQGLGTEKTNREVRGKTSQTCDNRTARKQRQAAKHNPAQPEEP